VQTLIDCDILQYCQDSDDERVAWLDAAASSLVLPVYSLPVLELCRAIHLMVKLHNLPPTRFREYWARLSERHIQHGEYCIHVYEHLDCDLPRDIVSLRSHRWESGDPPPCEGDADRYWDRHRRLLQRLRFLYSTEGIDNWWEATCPQGHAIPPTLHPSHSSSDIVIDTNNLIELLNQLPVDGLTVDARTLHFPSRLSENAVRRFRFLITNRGVAGKIIVPISVLEETEGVINKPENVSRYDRARDVLRTMSINPELPLSNIFFYERLTQDILDYFLALYEFLTVQAVNDQEWDDFGDMLVLAHGLYNGCRIASNEWFEGRPDVWDVAKLHFRHLVLE
jgi:hypothetical protein